MAHVTLKKTWIQTIFMICVLSCCLVDICMDKILSRSRINGAYTLVNTKYKYNQSHKVENISDMFDINTKINQSVSSGTPRESATDKDNSDDDLHILPKLYEKINSTRITTRVEYTRNNSATSSYLYTSHMWNINSQRKSVGTAKRLLSSGRKNVLFIVADDLRPQLNSYKGPHAPSPESNYDMKTPHLDILARKSLQLNRAYAQYSVCNPSRTSYMTGRRPDTTGIWDLKTYWRSTGRNFSTIPQYFKDKGYRTAGIGKIFHPFRGAARFDVPSWTEPETQIWDAFRLQDKNVSWLAVTKSMTDRKPLRDQLITTSAIQMMQNLSSEASTGDRPFFIAVGFLKPHLPFVFPEKYQDLYPLEGFELANNQHIPLGFPEIAWTVHEPPIYADIAKYNKTGITFNEILPDEAAIHLRRAYFACVSYIDDLVGKLLQAVHDLGLADNTVISFIGDHGWHLGENGMWGKHTNLEQATHAPMMLHIPGKTDNGIQSDSLVEFIDLFPSIVEAAGLDPVVKCPKNSTNITLCVEGTSFLKLIDNPKTIIKDAAISQMVRSTVKTDRYRYVEWPTMKYTMIRPYDICQFDIIWEQPLAKELYDHKFDLEENYNLIHEEIYRSTVKELGEYLRNTIPSSINGHCFYFGL